MANFFSKLFNSGKNDTTYQGQKPYSTLQQAQGGPEYYQTLVDRLAGKNVGFGDDYASKYANPIIQNSRQQFNDYQLPELKSELSATGRRGGSGGFDQIRRAYSEQGNAENDVFSRLQQRNEDQSRSEINAALPALGSYAQNEAGMQNNYSNFDYRNNQDQVTQANATRANESQGLGNLVNAGADAIGNYVIPGASALTSRLANRTNSFSTPPAGYNLGFNPFGKVNKSAQAGRIL